MAKIKVSATVDPTRLERAKELTGCDNVSELLDQGLQALIEARLEQVHAESYGRLPQGAETMSEVEPAAWSELPWDEA